MQADGYIIGMNVLLAAAYQIVIPPFQLLGGAVVLGGGVVIARYLLRSSE